MDVTTLKDKYRSALRDDILPFWINHAIDRENGGYFSALDRDGALLDTDKSVWVQGRFAWLLGAVSQRFDLAEDFLSAAKQGLDFIDRYCVDREDGLMWFQVTGDGQPIRKRRYRFSEAFACIANAAHFQTAGEESCARNAVEFFKTFHAHKDDPTLSPFPLKYTGTRPSKALGAPMIGINMAQICRAAGLPGIDWDRMIDLNISEIESDFVHPEIECVMEVVGADGERIDDHFDGRTLNPGHAIEAAWFILEEAKHRDNDSGLIELGTKMLDWMWERGWDNEYGGILYFTGVDQKPVQEYWHDMKFWWPQNEAEIATLLAWQLTGEKRHLDRHTKIHEWAWSNFPDTEFGEWYGYLHRDGSVSNRLKGNLWKGPFHIPRMMLKCFEICEEMER